MLGTIKHPEGQVVSGEFMGQESFGKSTYHYGNGGQGPWLVSEGAHVDRFFSAPGKVTHRKEATCRDPQNCFYTIEGKPQKAIATDWKVGLTK